MTEATIYREVDHEEHLRALTSVEKKRMQVILMRRAGRDAQEDQLRWITEEGNSEKFRKFIESPANCRLVLKCLESADVSLWKHPDNKEEFLAYLGSVDVSLLEEVEKKYKDFSPAN